MSRQPVEPVRPSASQPPRGLLSTLVTGPQPRFWLALLGAIALYALFSLLLTPQTAGLPAPLRLLAEALMLGVAMALPFWYLLYLPAQQEARAAREAMERETQVLHERLRGHDLNVRLAAALDMAEDEDAVLRIARQGLAVAADGAPAQLLLADAPDTPMRHNLVEGELGDEVRCFIERPADCPAVRRGMGTVYEDSLVLSACRGLKGPIGSACAAACTPITVAGSGVGMVRALGPVGDPGLYRLLQSLNTAAHHVGARLAVIRSISASARQAATDPMTGAANRRSGEARLAELAQQGGGHVLAMIDIDFFKKINDQHGHEVGDRAIKLLVEVLREGFRSQDLVCRYGGEEFLLILPGIKIGAAVVLLERIRAELAGACARAGLPVFTVSVGVADGPITHPAQQLRAADAALYRAKGSGRDRIVCAEPLPAEMAGPAS